MRDYTQQFGKKGEDLAARYLQKKGYTLLDRNYRAERGEIDLIVTKDQVLVFVEVKTQGSLKFGEPEMWVDHKKQVQIGKVAMAYLQEKVIDQMDCRFDVVTVVGIDGNQTVRHIENAFWLESD
jgi:putative endonuclease